MVLVMMIQVYVATMPRVTSSHTLLATGTERYPVYLCDLTSGSEYGWIIIVIDSTSSSSSSNPWPRYPNLMAFYGIQVTAIS